MSAATDQAQAAKLAELRARAPLPPPMVPRPGSGEPAAPLVAPQAATNLDQGHASGGAAPPPAPVRAAPIDTVTVRYHAMPESKPDELEASKAKQDEAIRVMRLGGYDPWSPVPDPLEALNAFRAGKLNTADLPVAPTMDQLQATLRHAKAVLQVARQQVADAQRPVDRASADVALLERDIAAEAGLERETAECFARCVSAGAPPELSPELTFRVEQRDAARARLSALMAALGPLQTAADIATTELGKAQETGERAALAILAAQAEQMAAEAVAARDRWTELRNEIYALGAVRLGHKTPKLSWTVNRAVNDPGPAKAELSNDTILKWRQWVVELLEGDTAGA